MNEQGMAGTRSRSEFRMKLTPEEPWMIRQLDNLDQVVVDRKAREDQATFRQALSICIVELVAMPVPLMNFIGTVTLVRQRIRSKATCLLAKAHGTAHVVFGAT